MPDEPRRRIPRTDVLLAHPALTEAIGRLGRDLVHRVVTEAQGRARAGEIVPEAVLDEALAHLPLRASSLRPVLNATGVVVHTNLGRAPLSSAAQAAMIAAAGYTDVELDLATGTRAARRGGGVIDALCDATAAEDALVVTNGAAALLLATTALATAPSRGVVVSRGEMVEIGDGFRLPDLIASTGVRLVEVGTTNRTRLADYEAAVHDEVAAILKVHPSNFVVTGFTSSVSVRDLARLGRPLIVDIGSGLLRPDPALPHEPDAATTLAEGATLVTASCDKLLGGPQAGLVLGARDVIERLRRHPMARALRVDKLPLAALEATLVGPEAPVTTFRHLTADDLLPRTEALARRVGGIVLPHTGRVGGGGAPGVELPGWAVALPEAVAGRLRGADPAVLARVTDGQCLVDLRCIPPEQDDTLAHAIVAALREA